MLPALTALIALQKLDSAVEAARRRLGELPGVEREWGATLRAASAAVDAARERLKTNQQARRDLEKDVAQVDTRLARFEDHKAAVKTNQEFTALLHEISTAKGEKDAIEDRILALLEEADGIAADIAAAESGEGDAKRDAGAAQQDLTAEQASLEATLVRLAAERAGADADVDGPTLAKYEQLLTNRRMGAVAPLDGEICAACYVRLRPAVAQQIRRNDSIVQCDNCQRILYAPPKETP
jgi:predicted  nucleic acid-binding Zn-ribbon protein